MTTERVEGARTSALDLNRGSVRHWVAGAIGLLFLGMVIAGFDLWYQTYHYVATDNAQVTGRFVQIGAPGPGLLTSVEVQVGQDVLQGQSVAVVQMGSPASAGSPTGWSTIHLRAPRSGAVASVPVREGQLLTTGQPVALIVDPDALWVVANMDEIALRGVQVGQTAEVRINLLDRLVAGRVAEIVPEFTQPGQANGGKARTTSLVPVRIDLEGDREGLYPGMTAYVKIRIR